MSRGKNQHIVPHESGGWAVKGENNGKATVVTETKKEAVELGRDIARNQAAELIVHGKDGKIQSGNSYGNDPYPPKG